MKTASLLFYSLALLLVGVASSQSATSSDTPLLVLYDGKVELSGRPPSETMNCTVVNQDGSIYLQRRQRVITEGASIYAYQGQLTQVQLVTLEKLLNNPDFRGVSDKGPSRMPQDSTDYAWVTAKIGRISEIQEIDYRYWTKNAAVHTEDPRSDSEYSSVPPEYVEQQMARLRILQPLTKWAHSISIEKLEPTEVKPILCSR